MKNPKLQLKSHNCSRILSFIGYHNFKFWIEILHFDF